MFCGQNTIFLRTSKRLKLQSMITGFIVSLLGTAFFPAQAAAGHCFFPHVQAQIKRQVEIDMLKAGYVCRGELICGIQLIPGFYRQRRYNPIWFDHNGLKPAAHRLIEIIGQIDQDGLNPADYHFPAIAGLLGTLNLERFPPDKVLAPTWAQLDLLLTDALLLLGAHLAGGRINPETLHADWIIPEPAVDMPAVLNKALAEDQLTRAIQQLRPAHPDYTGLQKALRHLRHIERQGGWPVIAAGRTIRPQETSEQVPAIRQRMIIGGDMPAGDPPADPRTYDVALVAAVKHFQQRHGLQPDGIIGRKTFRVLNTSVNRRIRQVELNLERWRWLPRTLGERYIAVNTAAFSLSVVESHQKVLDMRVVVGKPARRTPVFSAQLSYLVLNPYWNVPHIIAVEDIVPKLAQDVDYLARQSIKVFTNWKEDAEEVDPLSINWTAYGKSYFPFRLRQDPGEKNALGRIKFMFPNKFAVYLHDTPQRSLFEKARRSFSSGCIRVENALALAAYLLSRDDAWTVARLRAGLAYGQRRVVRIAHPIPVHLLYMTAWVDANQVIQFREDIYGRDRDLNRALLRRSPRTPFPRIIPANWLQAD